MAEERKQKGILEPRGLVDIVYPPPPGDGFVAIALDADKKYVAKGTISVTAPPKVLLEIQALDNDNEATRVGGTENSPGAGDWFTDPIQSDFGLRKCTVEADYQDVGEPSGFQKDDFGDRQFIALPNQFTITIAAGTVKNQASGCTSCDNFNTTYTLTYDSATPATSSWSGTFSTVCGQNKAVLSFFGVSSTVCKVYFKIRGMSSIGAQYENLTWNYSLASLVLSLDTAHPPTLCQDWPSTLTVTPV